MTGTIRLDGFKVFDLGTDLENCRYLEGARRIAAEWMKAIFYKLMKAREKLDDATDAFHKNRLWELADKIDEFATEIAEFDPNE